MNGGENEQQHFSKDSNLSRGQRDSSLFHEGSSQQGHHHKAPGHCPRLQPMFLLNFVMTSCCRMVLVGSSSSSGTCCSHHTDGKAPAAELS